VTAYEDRVGLFVISRGCRLCSYALWQDGPLVRVCAVAGWTSCVGKSETVRWTFSWQVDRQKSREPSEHTNDEDVVSSIACVW